MKGGNKSSKVSYSFTGLQTYSISSNQQNVQMRFTRRFIPFLWLLKVYSHVATCMHGKKVAIEATTSYHYIILLASYIAINLLWKHGYNS